MKSIKLIRLGWFNFLRILISLVKAIMFLAVSWSVLNILIATLTPAFSASLTLHCLNKILYFAWYPEPKV